jgi:hypothetical protein
MMSDFEEKKSETRGGDEGANQAMVFLIYFGIVPFS